MIRILHYGLSTNRGGIETYLYKLWSNIDQTKFHFDFIDTNIEKPCFYDEFENMGSHFYKITPRKKSIRENKKDLENLFLTERFDILHCHLNTLSYIEPVKVAMKYGCKIIVHSRNAGVSKSFITNVLHLSNKPIVNDNRIIKLAVSDKAGKWLFGNKLSYTVINNGIEIEKFKFNINKREHLRKELNIEENFVVGNVSAFLEAKNHKFLIKIFNKLIKVNPKAILLLVGEGPLQEGIKLMVKQYGLNDKVKFLGRRDDVADLLSIMDCFIFPSFFEGFPNAVLEAQCSGLQCVISDNISNEIAILERCIRLSLKDSIDEWVRNICFENDLDDREACGLDIYKKGFSVESEIRKVEKIYLDSFNNI